jgi:hypothetical protein
MNSDYIRTVLPGIIIASTVRYLGVAVRMLARCEFTYEDRKPWVASHKRIWITRRTT